MPIINTPFPNIGILNFFPVFITRITLQSVCILQGISCPVVWNVLHSRGVDGKEVISQILFLSHNCIDIVRRNSVLVTHRS